MGHDYEGTVGRLVNSSIQYEIMVLAAAPGTNTRMGREIYVDKTLYICLKRKQYISVIVEDLP